MKTMIPVAFAVFSLVACGGPDENNFRDYRKFYVGGIRYVVHPSVSNYTPARLKDIAAAAARYWDVSPAIFTGVTVYVVDQSLECNGLNKKVIGCTAPNRAIWVRLRDGCPEATALFHELGHAAIGDPLHAYAAWRDSSMASIWERLTEKPGCESPSRIGWRVVWRSEFLE